MCSTYNTARCASEPSLLYQCILHAKSRRTVSLPISGKKLRVYPIFN